MLPDGREGALVIYKTKGKDEGGREVWVDAVQWMPMIAGIRKKVRNSGEIATWDAQVVHAKDEFEYELGDEPFIKHRPSFDPDPGPVIAAYSVATLKTGEKSREVMTRSQLDKVRNASKSKDRGPWVDWYDEMCRKSVARRHSKVLPMSTDLDDLIRRDDALYDMQGARDQAVAAGGAKLSLAGKLDALAAGMTNAGEQTQSQTDDLPPETKDEVKQEVGGTASDEDAQTEDATPADLRDAVLEKLRGLVMSGDKRVAFLLTDLPPNERELVTEDDKKSLTAMQKGLEAQRAQAGAA